VTDIARKLLHSLCMVKGWRLTHLFSNLDFSGLATVRFYDQRDSTGTEFCLDKGSGVVPIQCGTAR